jgi:hypothetical protein
MSRISAYNQSSGRRQTNQIDNEVQIRQMDDILAEGGAAAQVDSREWDIDQELHRFLGRSSVPRSALRGNAVDLVDTVDTGFPPYANMVESERVDSCHGVVPWELSDGKSDKSACVLKHRTNCDEFGDTEHALSCLVGDTEHALSCLGVIQGESVESSRMGSKESRKVLMPADRRPYRESSHQPRLMNAAGLDCSISTGLLLRTKVIKSDSVDSLWTPLDSI